MENKVIVDGGQEFTIFADYFYLLQTAKKAGLLSVEK